MTTDDWICVSVVASCCSFRDNDAQSGVVLSAPPSAVRLSRWLEGVRSLASDAVHHVRQTLHPHHAIRLRRRWSKGRVSTSPTVGPTDRRRGRRRRASLLARRILIDDVKGWILATPRDCARRASKAVTHSVLHCDSTHLLHQQDFYWANSTAGQKLPVCVCVSGTTHNRHT